MPAGGMAPLFLLLNHRAQLQAGSGSISGPPVAPSADTLPAAPERFMAAGGIAYWHGLSPLMPRKITIFNKSSTSSCLYAVAALTGVPERFVNAGGMASLFLLLHHEVSGGHHSKLASSLVSLLNFILGSGAASQVRWGD